MKIVHIFPGKVWGGAEQYVLDLGEALASRGHEVSYVAQPAKAVTDRLTGAVNFTVARLGGIFPCAGGSNLADAVRGADVVHVHDLKHVVPVSKAIAKSGAGARIVVTRHIARASRVNPWIRPRIKNVSRIIFVSHLGKKLWHGANRWMPEEKCMVVHNSIPPYRATEVENLRERYGLEPDVPLLMFTGRIRKSKGCMTLVEALAKVKDLKWHMVFVGRCKPADYDKELLETAAENGIASRIGFMGFSDRVRALIRQADIGVAPSIVREACPLTPMEFMQAGVCVVATDNGAQPEYITSGKTGMLVKPGDVESTAAALRTLLTDKQRRDTIAAKGKEHFENRMSYDSFIENILSAYES